MKSTKRIVMIALMVTIALILSIIEGSLPLPMIVPGAKIGLANIVTMICIVLMTTRDAFTVLILRIVLSSIFVGGFSGFIYSLSGGVLSFLMMYLVIRLIGKKVSMIGIGVTGAYFHSAGQVIAASIILQNIRIMSYLPFLLIASIFAGIFIGLASDNLIKIDQVKRSFQL